MKTNRFATLALSIAAVVMAGCGGSSSESSGTESSVATDALPATLFSSSAPGDAVPLIDAKTTARQGDRVVIEARVGGRMEPFIENRAVFFVTDSSIISCEQMDGDHCKTPWDYCCEPSDNLLKHMATVQVTDASGVPLKATLRDQHGLAPLKTVIVAGTVVEADASGSFIVSAESIHIKDS